MLFSTLITGAGLGTTTDKRSSYELIVSQSVELDVRILTYTIL